jgi:hypothetical protein
MSFQIQFNQTSDYLLIPLASFAADVAGKCNIFVEGTNVSDSKSILLGAMLFQQIAMKQK